MRLPDGERLLVVVVVEDDGMAAMMSMMVSGDTPRFAGVQPATDRNDTAAIAPIRGSGGVIIMLAAKASSGPRVREITIACERAR
jgi:hypothetical protein